MDDLRDQIFGKVTGDMDIFKKLGTKIPGFSGYIERQNRRDSDKLLRDLIFKRFREMEGRVSSLQRDFIKHGEIQYVDDLEAVAIKLRTFADKVHTAPRGYSGLFDAVSKNEAELQRLYEFDAALLEMGDEVDRAIDNVETSVGTDGLPASIRNLETNAQLCVDTYNQREDVFVSTFSSEDIEGEI